MSADNRILYHQHTDGLWYVWHGSCSSDYHEPPNQSPSFSSETVAMNYAVKEAEQCAVLEGGIERLSNAEIIRALREDLTYYKALTEAWQSTKSNDNLVKDDEPVVPVAIRQSTLSNCNLVKGQKYAISYVGPYYYTNYVGVGEYTGKIEHDVDGDTYGFILSGVASSSYIKPNWFPIESIFELHNSQQPIG